jgi:hypothetical protein
VSLGFLNVLQIALVISGAKLDVVMGVDKCTIKINSKLVLQATKCVNLKRTIH